MLSALFLAAGFFTETYVSTDKILATRTFSDSGVMPQKSNISVPFEVYQNRSDLRIDLVANRTLTISVFQADTLRWSWWRSELKMNIMGNIDVGNWATNFDNNSTESTSFTYFITLSERHEELTTPFIWLSTPFLISGGVIAFIIPTIYLFNIKFKSLSNTHAHARHIRMIIIGVIVGIILLSLFFSYQIGENLLHTNYPWVIATGVSMEPTMYDGDLVIMRGVDQEALIPGDIILFTHIFVNDSSSGVKKRLSIPIMHRIIEKVVIGNQTYFQTQGDNRPEMDEWLVPGEEIVGEPILIIPRLGLALRILSLTTVKVFIISLIIFVFIFWPQIKPEKTKVDAQAQNRACNLYHRGQP